MITDETPWSWDTARAEAAALLDAITPGQALDILRRLLQESEEYRIAPTLTGAVKGCAEFQRGQRIPIRDREEKG